MLAIDTNILVYAHRNDTPLHRLADASVKELCENAEPWALPLPCISEFLRVVTHPRYLAGPSDIDNALTYIASVESAPSCQLLRPGEQFLDHLFTTVHNSSARGQLVFDAQIVALCREHGVDRILTNDRDFARFDGIEIERLGGVHEPQARYSPQVKVSDFLPR